MGHGGSGGGVDPPELLVFDVEFWLPGRDGMEGIVVLPATVVPTDEFAFTVVGVDALVAVLFWPLSTAIAITNTSSIRITIIARAVVFI